MEKIDRVIAAFRRLREEVSTNNVGGGQIAGTVEAGDNPPVRSRRKFIYQKGLRKTWGVNTSKK